MIEKPPCETEIVKLSFRGGIVIIPTMFTLSKYKTLLLTGEIISFNPFDNTCDFAVSVDVINKNIIKGLNIILIRNEVSNNMAHNVEYLRRQGIYCSSARYKC